MKKLKAKTSHATKGSRRTKKRVKRASKYPWYAKYIFAAARKAFRWSPAKREALKAALFPGAKEYYVCAACPPGNYSHKEYVHVDHKDPVIDPSTGFSTWDDYFTRLFCGPENLQVLCTNCHKTKTKQENGLRRQARKEKGEQ